MASLRRIFYDVIAATAAIVGWLVGCCGFNGPSRHSISVDIGSSPKKRKIERKEIIKERIKIKKKIPTRTYCK